MATSKPEITPDYQEFEAPNAGRKNHRVARTVESIHLALTTLALLAGISIVGVAGDTLSVYNTTHLGKEYLLPLWPNEFDIRPTIALVTCGSIILVSSAIALLVSKLPLTRNNPLVYAATSFLVPAIGLVAALIGMSFFYGVNTSTSVYSLQAWSCQWSSIDMTTKPHFSTLCKESKAALYLMVMTVPLEVLVLATASWGAYSEKKQPVVRERKGSPAMS